MKKILRLAVAFAVAVLLSGSASAQGKSGGHGNKPAQTGLNHAESTANTQGMQHGIENAETKQAQHDATKSAKKKSSSVYGKKTRTRKNKKTT